MEDEEYQAWRKKTAIKRMVREMKIKYTVALRKIEENPSLIDQYFPPK